jgi:hypothetical protein
MGRPGVRRDDDGAQPNLNDSLIFRIVAALDAAMRVPPWP